MKTFTDWKALREVDIPGKPEQLKMSDEDWTHQYTSGNLEYIMEDAMDNVMSDISQILNSAKSQVYSRLYDVFANPQLDAEKIGRLAKSLLMQELKKQLGG